MASETDSESVDMEDEASRFLGNDPAVEPENLTLRNDVEVRIKSWIKTGMGKKETKEAILEKIPMKGQLNLEAPRLNEEIAVDLHPKAAARDEHFRDYQNLTGAALSSTATVLSQILSDADTPLDRESILNNLSLSVKILSDLFYSLTQARKTFLLGKYEEKIQKIFKKVEPTTMLFGDNLKGLLETSRAMERGRTREPIPEQAIYLQEQLIQAEDNRTSKATLPAESTSTEQALTEQVNKCAARLRFFENNWVKITDDYFVINTIRGYKINFENPPFQTKEPHTINANKNIDLAIDKLVLFKAIEICEKTKDQFLSPYFLRQKPDGTCRFILNLRNLNIFIKAEHFKIEDIRTALNLLDKGDYMIRLDLKDAFLLVPVDSNNKKYLRFKYKNKHYQFNALPFGLSSAPYVFTKIMKPVVNILRKRGIKLVVYIDDFLIIADSKEKCQKQADEVISLLTFLGFILNREKSDLIPKNACKFLGMILNSANMTIELPTEKRGKIKKFVSSTLLKEKITIQKLSELIGVLVAACPGMAYGWLFYKELETQKRNALLIHNNDTSKSINLTKNAKKELEWWDSQILITKNKIRPSCFDLEIFSDASTTGWGAICEGKEAKGFWNIQERNKHINFLEIKAALLGLKSFASSKSNSQILLRIDNLTALAYINKMGGIKHKDLHELTKELWEWCRTKEIWVFAEYVASKNNPADLSSRITNIDTEWELSLSAYQKITRKFGQPTIDLFATRINTKCAKYCSWERDPEAFSINSFTTTWKHEFWYAFPPFALIGKILKKIRDEGSEGILVVPLWYNQPWYPEFKRMLVSDTIVFKPSTNLLISPCRKMVHPLSLDLSLASGIVSGRHTEKRAWKKIRLQ